MANQTRQLAELLGAERIDARVIQVNAPYRPAWIGRVRGLRALFRLFPYLVCLWRSAKEVQVFHVMANSGWAWHLLAAPAIRIGRLRGKGIIVNYRGGGAEAFFARSFGRVRPTLRKADLVVVPSGFLESVFAQYGIESRVVPNIINLQRFFPAARDDAAHPRSAPHLIVTRNLEAIYEIPTALRAFARVFERHPTSRLTIAGSGPERATLAALAGELGIAGAVAFPGRLESDAMAALYRDASVMLNPSGVDNMPNSVLEALASGVPVVSTNVGGIRHLVEDGKTALLVPPGEPQAMATAVERLLADPHLTNTLIANGLALAQRYAWSSVREQWFDAYRHVAAARAAVPGGHERR